MAAPAIAVIPAASKHQPALRRLMQLYCYDFSEFTDIPINDEGVFGHPEFIEEQFGPNHDTYIIHANDRLAGFAIVTPRSLLEVDDSATDMTQFFVLRGWRRQGVGRHAAIELFQRYPGRWEVRVIQENEPAQIFWRAVIRGFTRDRFSEEPFNSDRHRGPVFSFETP